MARWPTVCAAIATLLLLVGCESSQPARDRPATAATPPTPPARQTPPASLSASIEWRFPAAERVIAFADVHGDLNATRGALKLPGLIDDSDRWIGGTTVVVQTGDLLDRGDDEQAIVELLLRLQKEAKEAGGAMHILHGNHELMNVAGDLRYVTPGGFRDFEDVAGHARARDDPRLSHHPPVQRPRVAAFLPGGVYAKKIAAFPVVVVVGNSVFSHADLLPKYAGQVALINSQVASWLLGGPAVGVRVIQDSDSPVWSRRLSVEPTEQSCQLLDESLRTLKVARMVVGHSPQPTIRPACDGKLWRIDVGMAAYYGGKPEVLEITKAGARPIR